MQFCFLQRKTHFICLFSPQISKQWGCSVGIIEVVSCFCSMLLLLGQLYVALFLSSVSLFIWFKFLTWYMTWYKIFRLKNPLYNQKIVFLKTNLLMINSIFFLHISRQMLKLLNILYLMFIGDLGAEIQAILFEGIEKWVGQTTAYRRNHRGRALSLNPGHWILGAEIQAIVWRSWKMSWSSPVYFPPLCIHRDSPSVRVHTNGKTWTEWFLDDFRKWSVSRLLDHLWTSNKVYLGAATFVATNMEKIILNLSRELQKYDCLNV